MFDLSPKAITLIKKLPKILLFTFIIGIVAWFVAVRPALAYLEKKKFEAAYSELQKLSVEIQSKIGPADEVSDDNSCGRANLKNQKGPLSCSTGLNIVYYVENLDEANIILDAIAKIHEPPLRTGPLTDSVPFVDPQTKKTQIIYQDIDSISGFSCSNSYELRTSNNEIGTTKLEIKPSCYGPAITEYF